MVASNTKPINVLWIRKITSGPFTMDKRYRTVMEDWPETEIRLLGRRCRLLLTIVLTEERWNAPVTTIDKGSYEDFPEAK